MKIKTVFLSHILDGDTPTYGNRNTFEIFQNSSIDRGDIANDSAISTTVHIGTHIDMPYHFYSDGQTIEHFDASFWFFKRPACIEIEPEDHVIHHELIHRIERMKIDTAIDILMVKTGIEKERGKKKFWKENPGFSPELYGYLKNKFPKLRVFGFDSISVSSFAARMVGREAHRKFLDPEYPILLLEDMRLVEIDENTPLYSVIIAPTRIAKSDGLPCTVFAEIEER